MNGKNCKLGTSRLNIEDKKCVANTVEENTLSNDTKWKMVVICFVVPSVEERGTQKYGLSRRGGKKNRNFVRKDVDK